MTYLQFVIIFTVDWTQRMNETSFVSPGSTKETQAKLEYLQDPSHKEKLGNNRQTNCDKAGCMTSKH